MLRLTREQVRRVDQLAIERFAIPGIVLMENAALAGTHCAVDMLCGASGKSVLILCGGGNNGGDGLAMARHLHNQGAAVQIACFGNPEQYQGDALINWRIIQAMNLPVEGATVELVQSHRWDLLVDAVFGTGLTQVPRDPFPQLAEAINRSGRPVLAVDNPSGLDADKGVPAGACIVAKRTITFVAEKVGFANPESRKYTGIVTVGGIGCPKELIRQVIAGG